MSRRDILVGRRTKKERWLGMHIPPRMDNGIVDMMNDLNYNTKTEAARFALELGLNNFKHRKRKR